jgi:hypothetical protein
MFQGTMSMLALRVAWRGSGLRERRESFHSLIKKRRPRRGEDTAERRVPSVSSPDVDDVEVHDDFFPSDTQAEIQRLLDRPKWSFTGGRATNRFWHMDGLEAEPYFREHLFGLIQQQLPKLKTYTIERIYANGQTAQY